ncbi:hypothetical protein Hlac_3432 (plasmid) [Halorubrum lacusprofundi ATCC 49239]|uniref:Uncharacterized protein n=1 Tax=Halorubrum lacusprofundi (strain ATCC 49239 / DSM 5036 / JCM 8891 / ACAM 34) TaxID=416348 RepID=B9LWV3_HALLT|nr:hypothetical protein Hlac_3432 [Halorubrum lacusprofundi ATCC 49239]
MSCPLDILTVMFVLNFNDKPLPEVWIYVLKFNECIGSPGIRDSICSRDVDGDLGSDPISIWEPISEFGNR